MTYFGTSDLPALLADFGVPVVWGAVSGKGIVDRVDREMLAEAGNNFTGKEIMVTLETERFAGLKEGETLFIEGAPHRVLQAHQAGDGALTEVLVLPTPGIQPAPLRVAKGADPRWDNAIGPDPVVPSVTLAAGSTLVVAVVTTGGAGPGKGASAVSWGAVALTKRGERAFGARGMVQFWTLQNASAGTADVTADIPVANGVAGVIEALEIQNAAAASFDQLWSASGNDTSPTVTADNPTAHANSILLAVVGQEGGTGASGAWSNTFLQGHYAATQGEDNDANLNGAYRVVSSTGIYSVANPGRPSAPWAILLMSIKGA